MRTLSTILALTLSTAAWADEPTDIFTAPPSSVYFVMDFKDVDIPGGREYQSITPTVGAGFALSGNVRLNVEASRRQIVEPVFHGAETRVRVGIGKRF